MSLGERLECAGGVLDLVGFEEIERGFVFARFDPGVAGRFACGLCAGRAFFGRRRVFSVCCFGCFELAQATVEVDVEVLLTLLGGVEFVSQRFNLPAQSGAFLAAPGSG